MSRTLLLCFIHGFKGSQDTFSEFPQDLKRQVVSKLPDHHVECAIYPKYETKGELSDAARVFLEWLKERVLEIRKANMEKPWPPNDRNVGVVLVAHSMGGFVAADSLFLAINERAQSNPSEDTPIFPLIQGILTFDTPFNGLARSMFVYGAFSNYQKVSSVFNVMTALSAAAPAGIARLASRRAATSAAASARSPAWKKWQVVAMRTGTVGAIAAGGVAAYVHRQAIMEGLRSISTESVKQGYRQSVDALSQGLAYINRGSVGDSLVWLSSHFAFVNALLKQKELNRRLERMGALKGVGIHDFYCSLGENGFWQGGYYVPERTFCAVPEQTHPAYALFSRQVMPDVDDEVQAHINMFRPEKNSGYGDMTASAASLVAEWFQNEAEVVDDPKFRELPPEEAEEDAAVDAVLEKTDHEGESAEKIERDGTDQPMDDISPIDIAAAASLVPQPQDGEGDLVGYATVENADPEKRTYLQYLFLVAQQAGSGAKGWLPSKMPGMPNIPSMPALPDMPKARSSLASLGRVSIPGANIFKKQTRSEEETGKGNPSGGDGQDEKGVAEKEQSASLEEGAERPVTQ